MAQVLAGADGEVLLLGLTPPRRSVSPAEAAQIAKATLARLEGLALDGLVVYRCVGKYPEAELSGWLRSVDVKQVLSVFVGSSSSQKSVHTSAASPSPSATPDMVTSICEC